MQLYFLELFYADRFALPRRDLLKVFSMRLPFQLFLEGIRALQDWPMQHLYARLIGEAESVQFELCE